MQQFVPQITLEEINQMVSSKIRKENIVMQISVPESNTIPTEQGVMALLNKAEATKHEPYIDDLGDGSLLKEEPKSGKVASSKKLPNFDVTEVILSNGARVLLKSTDFKNDQILMSCYASGGASVYPDNEYQLIMNSDEIVDNCGLGDFKATQLSKLLQGKMISLSPYIAGYEQGMYGSTTPKDIEIFFQLLHMQFTQPRKDADAFSSWKDKTDDMLRSRRNDPMSAFQDTVSSVLSGYHIRGNALTRDDVEGFDLDRAFNVYKERFADASNFTFVFVGAFNINEITPLLERYVASLPSTNKKEKAVDLGIKPAQGIVKKIVQRGIEPKSQVSLYIDNDLNNYSSEENLKISILSEILTIKIRESLREEIGGVYSPWGRISTGYFPRKFVRAQLGFVCDPGKVDELVTAAYEVFDNSKNEIRDENMLKAKEILKSGFDVNLKENNY